MTLFNVAEKRKPGFRLALFGCLFAVVVVGLGAFTRLVDAGLGCPDWPTCYGHVLWPDEHHEVEAANLAFPDTPVEHDKTWPEQVHRIFASSLGLITIALMVLAFRHRASGTPVKLSIFLFAFIILQGMFGMWTVTLKLWPQVVTAHLLGGFTTLSLLWLMTLRLNNRRWQLQVHEHALVRSLKRPAVIGLLVVIAQIALGGWTTSNYAAVACPDLPTCQGQWLPPMDFAHGFNIFQHIGPNYLGGTMANEGRVAIHFMHRVGAIVTAVYLIFLLLRMRATGVRALAPMARAITVVLVLQLSLGLANVLFKFPLAVAVGHNMVGALLLLTLVTLNYGVYTAQVRREEQA